MSALELDSDTPTQMCPRCGTHSPVEVPTVNDGPREVEHCPFCGMDLSRDISDDAFARYFGDGSPRSDLEELAAAIRETTAARGADLFAVKVAGLDGTEWADMTDRDASTVSRNVRRATED